MHNLTLLFVYICRHIPVVLVILGCIIMVVFPFSTENNYFPLLLTIFNQVLPKTNFITNLRTLFEIIFYPNLVLQQLVNQPQRPEDQVPD